MELLRRAKVLAGVEIRGLALDTEAGVVRELDVNSLFGFQEQGENYIGTGLLTNDNLLLIFTMGIFLSNFPCRSLFICSISFQSIEYPLKTCKHILKFNTILL